MSSVDVALFGLLVQLLISLIDYRNSIKESVIPICRADCYRFGGLESTKTVIISMILYVGLQIMRFGKRWGYWCINCVLGEGWRYWCINCVLGKA